MRSLSDASVRVKRFPRQRVRRSLPSPPTCPECGGRLWCFEGAKFCPDCTRVKVTAPRGA